MDNDLFNFFPTKISWSYKQITPIQFSLWSRGFTKDCGGGRERERERERERDEWEKRVAATTLESIAVPIVNSITLLPIVATQSSLLDNSGGGGLMDKKTGAAAGDRTAVAGDNIWLYNGGFPFEIVSVSRDGWCHPHVMQFCWFGVD